MKIAVPTLVLCLALLAGCGSNRYCLRQQKYDNAASIPPIKPVAGLKIPDSPTAMRVPPAPAAETPFGSEIDDPAKPGKKIVQCLDRPPPMPPLAPEPAATPSQ